MTVTVQNENGVKCKAVVTLFLSGRGDKRSPFNPNERHILAHNSL